METWPSTKVSQFVLTRAAKGLFSDATNLQYQFAMTNNYTQSIGNFVTRIAERLVIHDQYALSHEPYILQVEALKLFY